MIWRKTKMSTISPHSTTSHQRQLTEVVEVTRESTEANTKDKAGGNMSPQSGSDKKQKLATGEIFDPGGRFCV